MNPAMLSTFLPVLTRLLNGGQLDSFLGGEQATTLKALTGGHDLTAADQVLAAIVTLATHAPVGDQAEEYVKAVTQVMAGVATLRGLLST